MLISLDWIKDFSPLENTLTPNELGLKLTMGTAEVEGVETINMFWKEVKTVEVTHIEGHPEADKLNLVTFKLNDKESFRVVCGASNVRMGMKTVFAPIGTTLPIGFTLEPKKIRGIISEGMLCSEEELGLATDSPGIMDLPEDTPVGVDLLTLWGKKEDVVFDIDNKSLTHRPDLWGHFGLAREFSALYEVPFNSPFNEFWIKNIESMFTKDSAPMGVQVDPGSSCLAYFGISLDNVVVGESPRWIKDRLLAVGLRPINNIVDISNYVMLELGIPLHIFDRDLIEGKNVQIKSLNESITFTTLDEVERTLIAGDTVISDSKKPLVLAGIMGGLNSGVTESTTKIFIEVANWKAAEVRKTSTRLGLRTDSSMRYEKTLDSQLCYRSLLRTIELIKQLCPDVSVIGKPQYDGNNLEDFKPLVIKASVEEITKTLGKEISTHKIIDILERLDFKVSKGDESLLITVPSNRSTKDIECQADIIEEIGRVIGYDNITPVGPLLDVGPVRLNPLHILKRKAQDFLSQHSHAFEVTSYPMVGESLLKRAQWTDQLESLKLINSLSVEQDRMRDSFIPSFLEIAALNSKTYENFRFFELGKTYHFTEDKFSEEKFILGLSFYSRKSNPILDLLNHVERLGNFLNLPMDIVEKQPKFKNNVVDESWLGLHPYEFRNLRIMGKMDGAVFGVHPLILKTFKIKGNLAMAFIDLTQFEKRELKDKLSYRPLSKFPSSRFDYTVCLNKDQSVEDIFNALKKVKMGVEATHKIVDIYNPDNLEKFVTMGTFLSDSEKTLEGSLIKECEEKIINSLEKASIFLKKG
ncbi:MAG: phenylalanine--tRNA ligase subunit beta [Bacteriovoracaceae bacterium]|nr:phenylalanine--tRNA ligase subunit beta [Bacteriovoracaceae bacterium]